MACRSAPASRHGNGTSTSHPVVCTFRAQDELHRHLQHVPDQPGVAPVHHAEADVAVMIHRDTLPELARPAPEVVVEVGLAHAISAS